MITIQWERRGTMIYTTADTDAPGEAVHVATAATTEDADRIVTAHNHGGRTAKYRVGDTVAILNAVRLPRVREIIGRGVVERITTDTTFGEPLYWIQGRGMALSERVLWKP